MIADNTITRISSQQAFDTYRNTPSHDLFQMGRDAAHRLHPTGIRTYVVERNINYTNVCLTGCKFCAFQKSPKSQSAYTLTDQQIGEKIEALLKLGGTQILLQGGLNPNLPVSWYEEMLKDIKDHFPDLHIHGFSPEEICFFSDLFELPVQTILARFHQAGLDSIPGAGGEILVDRVRDLIAPQKCKTGQWLEVMRQAHKLGISTTATMMFGHVESVKERIEHLECVRQLQDESLAARQENPRLGRFTAFICWPFQPGHTPLSRFEKFNPLGQEPRKGNQILLAGAFEQLKMTALARIYLDNIPNIQASWVTQGPKIGQLSLLVGCNDMGSLMMEENVVSAVGTTFNMKLHQLRDLITTSGYIPVQRDYYYNYLENPETNLSPAPR